MSELTSIFNSKGIDGLTRLDRVKSAKYNRGEFLFEKFLKERKPTPTINVTHEHILDLGAKTFHKFKPVPPDPEIISIKYKKEFDEQMRRIEEQADDFRAELEAIFEKQILKERIKTKNYYEELMKRIEKQRDQLENERIKDVIRKMNEECEMALKKQWHDAEDLRFKTLEELKEIARKTSRKEAEELRKKEVQKALKDAEEAFKIRESDSLEKQRLEYEMIMNDQLRTIEEKNKSNENKLLKKIKDLEEKLEKKKNDYSNIENDFRLLQTDYKRFMDYTNHYNSDYMLKLRYIGYQVLEDREFEDKLNGILDSINHNKMDKKKDNHCGCQVLKD